MHRRRRWLHEAWIPVAAGMAWFASAAVGGWLAYLAAAFPGSMLLSAGVASALWPGDARATHFGSLGGFVGTLLGLASIAWLGVLGGLVLTVLSLASFVAVGHLAARDMSLPEEVPLPAWRSLRLGAEVAVDEGLLGALNMHLFGALNFVLPMALRYRRDAIRDETRAALELFRARGWVERPRAYHVEPPPLEKPDLRPLRAARVSFEHLSFPSGYEPHAEEPGRERWLSYQACRTAHAWVRRHESAERPWLVCIHGYQMGSPRLDFPAFWGEWLHRRLGLNLVFPVLPLHGPRTIGLVSGDGFFSGDLLDTVHAEAQAIWDMRRILAWIRAQGGTRIGLYGLSLGGYNAALLASLADDLACVVSGIPLADFARIVWWHGPPYELREAEREGIGGEAMGELLRVVAPLVLTPRVPRERRYLFGGSVDRLVPAEQVRDLWRHWERPKILWYPGAHVTFMLHREVRRFVGAALREAGLVA